MSKAKSGKIKIRNISEIFILFNLNSIEFCFKIIFIEQRIIRKKQKKYLKF